MERQLEDIKLQKIFSEKLNSNNSSINIYNDWLIKPGFKELRQLDYYMENSQVFETSHMGQSDLKYNHISIVIQLLSRLRIFGTPRTAARQASPSFTISQSLLKLIFIELVMLSNHLILCHPFLLSPSVFSSIRVFSNESVHQIRWLKYWSFNFTISPSNEYSGLISFRCDWLDLLAVQGTLKNLLQHHSSKASILWRSASFIVQISHLLGLLVKP